MNTSGMVQDIYMKIPPSPLYQRGVKGDFHVSLCARMGMGVKKILILAILLWVFGCTASPLPPEVKLAEEQEHNLWSAGAEVYAPVEYNRYRISFRQAKEDLIKEKSRFVWFQDYRIAQSEFRDVLKAGYVLQEKILKDYQVIGTENGFRILRQKE